MRVLLSIAVVDSVVATGVIAATAGLAMAMAAERPAFEMKSFPISTEHVQALGGAGVSSPLPAVLR